MLYFDPIVGKCQNHTLTDAVLVHPRKLVGTVSYSYLIAGECQIHSVTETITDDNTGCISLEPVEFKYCDGRCGNSTDYPLISPTKGVHLTRGGCKCCTARSNQQKPVLMSCPTGVEGELRQQEFFLPIVNQCLCLKCEQVPGESRVLISPAKSRAFSRYFPWAGEHFLSASRLSIFLN